MVGGCKCLNGFRPGNPSSFVTCVTVLAVASFLIPCLAFAQASSAKTETLSINQQLKAPMSLLGVDDATAASPCAYRSTDGGGPRVCTLGDADA